MLKIALHLISNNYLFKHDRSLFLSTVSLTIIYNNNFWKTILTILRSSHVLGHLVDTLYHFQLNIDNNNFSGHHVDYASIN